MQKTALALIGLSLGSTHAMDTAQATQSQKDPGLEARALAERNGPESLGIEQLYDATISLLEDTQRAVLAGLQERPAKRGPDLMKKLIENSQTLKDQRALLLKAITPAKVDLLEIYARHKIILDSYPKKTDK